MMARTWWLLLTLVVSCMGTETGNPPVRINAQLLHFRADRSDLEVVGDPGAVRPGGSVVEMIEVPSQRSLAEMISEEDGSFVLRAAGAANLNVVLRARNEDRQSRDVPFPDAGRTADSSLPSSTPTDDASTSGAAPDAETSGAPLSPDAGSPAPAAPDAAMGPSTDAEAMSSAPADAAVNLLSCEQLADREDGLIEDVLIGLLGPCVTRDDCVLIDPSTSCLDRCDMAIARASRGELEARLRNAEQTACAPFRASGCSREAMDCSGLETGIVDCVEQQCVHSLRAPIITDVDRDENP